MKGPLTKNPDGTLTAVLTCPLGYVHTFHATRTSDGYEMVGKLTHVPEALWIMGDEEYFEMVKVKRDGA